jgi:hypothetical protein
MDFKCIFMNMLPLLLQERTLCCLRACYELQIPKNKAAPGAVVYVLACHIPPRINT